MKKLVLFITLSTLILSGCKDNSDDPASECTITALKSKNTGETQSTTIGLQFDAQKRVTKADYKYLSDIWSMAYNYQTSTIVRTETEGTTTYTGTYTLTNGRVTKYVGSPATIDFTYNTDGYVSKTVITLPGTTVTNNLTYQDGNLKSIERKQGTNTSFVTISYGTDLAVDLLGYGNSLMLWDDVLEEAGDYFIVSAGYFGKASKNLPVSYTFTNTSSTHNVQYEKDVTGKILSMFKSSAGVDVNTSFTYTCN